MTTTLPMSTCMAREQILSWLQDSESMVTAQKIQQECFGETSEGLETCLSRKEASELLEGIYRGDPQSYIPTIVREEATNNEEAKQEAAVKVTTFSCKKLSAGDSVSVDASSSSSTSTTTTILALSKANASLQEALDACHESDMTVLRDRLYSKADSDADPSWFYKTDELSYIRMPAALGDPDTKTKPATPVEKTWHKFERDPIVVTKTKTKIAEAFQPKAKSKATATGTATAKSKGSSVKPTTAQSFFAAKPTAKSSSSAKSTSSTASTKTKTATATESKSKSKSASSSTASSSQPAFTKRVRPTKDKENKSVENDDNDQEPTTTTATVGNADDFVGDEDEDSEDEQDMQERREKSKEIVRKQKERDDLLDALGKEEDLDAEAATPKLTKGAMDAFCSKSKPATTTNSNSNSNFAGKKRRKVLKEKTTVNAQGFLVTTTEAVWEDVSDEEEEPQRLSTKKNTTNKSQARSAATRAKPTTTKPKKKKASDMKQGSLMGFFAVKNKK